MERWRQTVACFVFCPTATRPLCSLFINWLAIKNNFSDKTPLPGFNSVENITPASTIQPLEQGFSIRTSRMFWGFLIPPFSKRVECCYILCQYKVHRFCECLGVMLMLKRSKETFTGLWFPLWVYNILRSLHYHYIIITLWYMACGKL